MEAVLRAWNPWWDTGEVPAVHRGRSRHVTRSVSESMDLPHVAVITGLRRAGKTTILYQLVDDLLQRGVAPKDILLVNLEDPSLEHASLDALVEPHRAAIGTRRYVFLDEVQARPGWQRWILPHYEQKRPLKFVVSGSSADLATDENAALLTGRNLAWTIRPLDFQEYQTFVRPAAQEDPLLLDHYLLDGGLPEVHLVPPTARRGLLQQYFDQIVGRDVVRQGLDPQRARRLGVYLAETFARPHTRRALAKATGIGSLETLQKYLDALQRVFLVQYATRAATSPKPSLAERSPVKAYWTDIGMRNALVGQPRRDLGRQAENLVATTLTQHGVLEYWMEAHGRAEVDFVVRGQDGRWDAIQVWYDPAGDTGLDAVPAREWNGLAAFKDDVSAKWRGGMTLITARSQGEREGVQALPLHQWLRQDAA